MILPLSLIDMDNIDKYTDDDLLKILLEWEDTPYTPDSAPYVVSVLKGRARGPVY